MTSDRAGVRDERPDRAPIGVAEAGGSSANSGLSVALTTCDSMRTLPATLASVRAIATRIVVIDSVSRDGTVACARSFGAEVIYRPWSGHVAQKQFAIDVVSHPADAGWILLLDSDEAVDARLASAMTSVVARAASVNIQRVTGYELNRRLVFHERGLRGAFQPEWRTRLWRKGAGRVAGTPPHDFVAVEGPVRRLEGDLLHDSWANADDMLRRQVSYAHIGASQGTPAELSGGGLLDVMVRPAAAFVKQYLIKGGYRDGWRGMVAAGGASASTLMKHLAIAERRGLSAESEGRKVEGAELARASDGSLRTPSSGTAP